MGDVGDRNRDHEAARILRIAVCFRMDRVVVVAGVFRIDGDKRELAQVIPAAEGRGGGFGRFR